MTAAETHVEPVFEIGGELRINRVGYGAMHLTGFGMWGEPDDPDNAVAVLRRAVELGVNFIDTADSYGPAVNEQIIRRALHPYPEGLVISTKGGMLRRGPDDWTKQDALYIKPLGKPEYLRQQLELSLRNLGVDCIDLYQLHSIDPSIPLAEQVGALLDFQREGKVRHIGLSGQPGVTAEQLAEAQRYGAVASLESAYNIVDRTEEAMLRLAERQNIAFVPYFPLGHGGLVGPGSALAPLAAEFGATPSQLALAWLLHRSRTTILIPGTANLRHLEENVRAAELSFTEQEMTHITAAVDALGLSTLRPGEGN
ncbi:aldo/keto reductase [Lentzea sp. E54]|uniref:aldo/keto reductase n=1 Tax=Lentzea xerophila TaxID=3435883 RepID=UPI003DA2242D